MRATVAKIHIKNFIHNISVIKNHVKAGTKICVPVKADAYGHGAKKIAEVSEKIGIDYFAVATADEGKELREDGITLPVLILSIPSVEEIGLVVKYNLEPLAFTFDYIDELNEEAKKENKIINVHLKLDTGMGRIGARVEDALTIAKYISEKSNITLKGICTHFALSDSIEKNAIDYTRQQLTKFTKAVEEIKKAGIDPGIIHCANSGAVLMYPEAHFDMIRPGIICYGFAPDKAQYDYVLKNKILKNKFKPVMELETKVVAITNHEKDESISYGRTYFCKENTQIAVLPLGYADGLLRRYNPNLKVLIRGKVYLQVGRICMDQCMVNIGENSDVKIGDTVTIFNDDDSFQTADDIAFACNTISYEVLCCISKRVPRIYID